MKMYNLSRKILVLAMFTGTVTSAHANDIDLQAKIQRQMEETSSFLNGIKQQKLSPQEDLDKRADFAQTLTQNLDDITGDFLNAKSVSSSSLELFFGANYLALKVISPQVGLADNLVAIKKKHPDSFKAALESPKLHKNVKTIIEGLVKSFDQPNNG